MVRYGVVRRVGHVVVRTVCRRWPAAGSGCAVLSVPPLSPRGPGGVPDGDRTRGARGQDPWATGTGSVGDKSSVSASHCLCGTYGYAASLRRCIPVLSFCQWYSLMPAPGAESRNGVFFMVEGSLRVVRAMEAAVWFFCPRKPFARCLSFFRGECRMSGSWEEEERRVHSAIRQHFTRGTGQGKDIHMTLHVSDDFNGKVCLCK